MIYTWKSKDGRETKVDEMDVTHLANAIAFSRREYSSKVRTFKALKAAYDAELAEWQEVYDLTADGYPKQRELANRPVEPTKPEEPEALIALEAEAARRFMVRHDHDDLEDLEFHLEDLAYAQAVREIKGPPLGLVSRVRTDGLAEVKLFGKTSSIIVEPKKAVAQGAMLHANEVKVGSPRAQSAQAERETYDRLYAAAERYLRTPPFYRGIVAAPDAVAGSIWRKPFEACQSGRTESCFRGGHNED